MIEPYQIQISHEALNSFKQLDKGVAGRIRDRIEWLAANPHMMWHHAFPDSSHWPGLCKAAVDKYRVIYMPDHKKRSVVILIVEQRRNIYFGA